MAAASRRSGHVHRAAGGCTVFYVCAHQQGGLDCSRVPHRPAGVLVAQCVAQTCATSLRPFPERTADLQIRSALPATRSRGSRNDVMGVGAGRRATPGSDFSPRVGAIRCPQPSEHPARAAAPLAPGQADIIPAAGPQKSRCWLSFTILSWSFRV